MQEAERSGERRGVGELQLGPDADSAGDPGNSNPEGLEQAGQVEGSSVSFDCRVGGDDDLFETFLNPSQEFRDPEFLRTDAVEGGEGPPEHVEDA